MYYQWYMLLYCNNNHGREDTKHQHYVLHIRKTCSNIHSKLNFKSDSYGCSLDYYEVSSHIPCILAWLGETIYNGHWNYHPYGRIKTKMIMKHIWYSIRIFILFYFILFYFPLFHWQIDTRNIQFQKYDIYISTQYIK